MIAEAARTMDERPDVGADLVDHLAASLQLDEQWCVRAGRSFTWWGHRLAQQVWADAPVATGAGPVTRVHAQTDVLTGITEDEGTAERLSALNRFASISALLWQPGTGEVALHTAVSVAPGTEGWLEPILAVATSTQAAEAHMQVEEWARNAQLDRVERSRGSLTFWILVLGGLTTIVVSL